MEVFYIILGWLLGILSPGIISSIALHYKRDSLRRVIIGELKDLRKRLVFIPYAVNSRYGTFDKNLFVWTKTHTDDIEDIDIDGPFKAEFAKIEIDNDGALTNFLNTINSSREANPAFHFKQMEISVIESNLTNIDILDKKFLTNLLEIKFQINVLNEEIRSVNDYLKLTFDSNISAANHQIIKTEIINKNFVISKKAIYIVEKLYHVINL